MRKAAGFILRLFLCADLIHMIRRRIKNYTIGYANSVKNWERSLLNVPCFIIGNGPSLLREDISLVEKYFTIGINRAFYAIDSTILMWQDIQLWHTDKRQILKTKSIKYCSDRADVQGRFFHFKLTAGDYALPKKASTLHGRGSTGPLAFQLAYLLGCNPIILLGMDCRYEQNKTDFYGTNPMHKPHTLRNCRKGLNWIKNCESQKRIINCSENCVFKEQHPLEEAIKMIDNLELINREVLAKKIIYHNR